MSVDRRRVMIEPSHPHLSIVRQCELVLISRSTFYRAPAAETAENLALMRLVDEQFLDSECRLEYFYEKLRLGVV